MRDISIQCIVFFLLMLVVAGFSAKIEEREKKKETKLGKDLINTLEIFIVLLFLGFCGSAAAWIYETYLAEPPVPQAIIIMDHSGGILAEYENSSGDLSYSYDNDKIKITVDGEEYTYIKASQSIFSGGTATPTPALRIC